MSSITFDIEINHKKYSVPIKLITYTGKDHAPVPTPVPPPVPPPVPLQVPAQVPAPKIKVRRAFINSKEYRISEDNTLYDLKGNKIGKWNPITNQIEKRIFDLSVPHGTGSALAGMFSLIGSTGGKRKTRKNKKSTKKNKKRKTSKNRKTVKS